MRYCDFTGAKLAGADLFQVNLNLSRFADAFWRGQILRAPGWTISKAWNLGSNRTCSSKSMPDNGINQTSFRVV